MCTCVGSSERGVGWIESGSHSRALCLLWLCCGGLRAAAAGSLTCSDIRRCADDGQRYHGHGRAEVVRLHRVCVCVHLQPGWWPACTVIALLSVLREQPRRRNINTGRGTKIPGAQYTEGFANTPRPILMRFGDGERASRNWRRDDWKNTDECTAERGGL